jgi:RNA polymerase sigma factor (sigma-70 family)
MQEAKVRAITEIAPQVENPNVFHLEVATNIYHRMRARIAHLPKTERRVFDLFFVEEMSVEEVSAHLGISPRTTDNARSRVLTALRLSNLHLLLLIYCFIHVWMLLRRLCL